MILVLANQPVKIPTFLLQMTVEVAAGKEDCYFLPDIKADQSIELEFQVNVLTVEC